MISFIGEIIIPARARHKHQLQELQKAGSKFAEAPILQELRAEAKKRKILNLFLPEVSGLSSLEYAPLAEMLEWPCL